MVNPAPLSDDDDDGRKRHSPEMPARTPRRNTLLLWSLFRTRAHRDAHNVSVSSLGSLPFLECEKPCPVQGAQNTLTRAPRQRHADFEACETTHDHGRGTHRRCRWPLLSSPSPRARTCSLSLASGAEIPRACSLSVDLNGASRIARLFHHVFERLHGISRRTAPKMKAASIPVLKEYSRKFLSGKREETSNEYSSLTREHDEWAEGRSRPAREARGR